MWINESKIIRKNMLYNKVLDSAYALKSFEIIVKSHWSMLTDYQQVSVNISLSWMRFKKDFWTVVYNKMYDANL